MSCLDWNIIYKFGGMYNFYFIDFEKFLLVIRVYNNRICIKKKS